MLHEWCMVDLDLPFPQNDFFQHQFDKKGIYLKGATLKRAAKKQPFVTTEGFKPPTAGAEIQCSIQLSYVANLFLTMVEMVLPSACPANSLETTPITFPMSFIPSAPK